MQHKPEWINLLSTHRESAAIINNNNKYEREEKFSSFFYIKYIRQNEIWMCGVSVKDDNDGKF